MKQSATQVLIVLTIFLLAGSTLLHAQSDREVSTKRNELKKEYNDVQEKNQIIKAAAQDKPRPTTGRRRASASTGYDYTQVKGYTVRTLNERVDQLFEKAATLNMFEEEYKKDGTFPVAGRKGLGSAQLRRIEVYYVEATPEEIESGEVEPFDLIEVRVEKLLTLPAQDKVEEEEDAGLFGFGESSSEPVPQAFTLAGSDLWTALKMFDESLYDDILARRSQEPSIQLPADLFLPTKRGPFLVMTSRELATSTSRFTDFWNSKDTLQTVVAPVQTAASGPLSTQSVPVLYPEESKIRVRNPNREQLKITEVRFEGENAAEFRITNKLPILLDAKGNANDKVDIAFEYLGNSQYEVKSQVFIEAREAKATQYLDVIVNPGKAPSDFVTIDASLDKIELRSPARSSFAPDWKLSYTIGNDEIGLPRWSSGMSTLSIGYKQEMSVGLVLPMNMMTGDFPAPLGYDVRPLASPMGYNVSFDFAFGFPFALGGNLTIANKFDGVERYAHLITKDHFSKEDPTELLRNDFWHIGTVAQVYYPIMFKDRAENPSVVFRLNIGGAFMQIQRNHLVDAQDLLLPNADQIRTYGREFTVRDIDKMFTIGKEKDIVDVFIRVGFINVAAKNPYGLGIQYFSGRMMADAWLELTNWFRVEAKYSFLLRERELWENDASFFMISPRFRFGLPSLFN
jgi:hypothetical protein